MNQADIKNAISGATIRDDKVKGLMLRAFPGRKSFYLNFRTKTGIERKPKLGDLSVMSLDQARKVARDLLFEVAQGGDPMQTRQNEREAPIMSELWQRYWRERGSLKKSARDDQRLWTRNIEPLIGKRRVVDLSYDDCYRVHQSKAAAPFQANRTKALLSTMMNMAEKFGWRPDGSNPCRHVTAFPEKKRKRYMSPLEAQTIASLLRANEADNLASVSFVYLLIFTGARCGDIANARWADLDGNVLRLPDGKAGARPVHLADAAVDVLNKLPRTSGTLTGIASPSKLWRRIRKEAGCPDLRLHDLRHSFASVALQAGLSLAQIGELLGHKSAQTTMRYAHLMEDAATAAAAATADLIVARMTGSPRVAETA